MTTTTGDQVAPQLRRRAVNAAEDVLNAKKVKDREFDRGELFATLKALELVVASDLPDDGSIAEGVGFGVGDGKAVAEIIRFMGEHDAKKIGFVAS